MPIPPYVVKLLRQWRKITPYMLAYDWIFGSPYTKGETSLRSPENDEEACSPSSSETWGAQSLMAQRPTFGEQVDESCAEEAGGRQGTSLSK